MRQNKKAFSWTQILSLKNIGDFDGALSWSGAVQGAPLG